MLKNALLLHPGTIMPVSLRSIDEQILIFEKEVLYLIKDILNMFLRYYYALKVIAFIKCLKCIISPLNVLIHFV